ncbi:MAG: polyprenyl synthetase family protein [Candidatus Aenigmarchaeota archaeon]|nr:polyprenyl synthetase family protein [Candidatus Aenigmarchaeota archaeon]MDI6722293.1 polyprenyl synthetase family protein [Candidatus Aenigmarchaeota archaeon]
MGIEKMLEKKSKIINRAIEKYIPRKYGKKSSELTCGKIRYSFNAEAATRSLSKPAWELLDRGGKRWRPALFLMIAEALGADPKKYMDLVVIIEATHDGTLIIDDIEDSSELRRGKPCIHKIFGNDIAINAGNAMYYLPLLVLIKNEIKLPKEKLLRLYEIYAQEMINISLGQGMDIAWHRGLCEPKSVDEYLQMCAFKTGTLARMAAKFGAVVAGVDDEIIEKMGILAESIGIAFQIQDDILNLTADSGKNQFTKEYLGSDITEGKRSILVVHALSKANKKDRKRLLEILAMHTSDRTLISEAIDIIKKYKSIEYAKDFARRLVRDAWDGASTCMKESEAKGMLEAFCDFAIERGY